jgi:MTH538 TIR-like domain (DUF1863)
MGGLIDPNKGFFGLGGYGLLAPPVGGTRTLLGASTFPTKKRKAYIAFHYDDIMRVNNVRNVWKIDHPDAPLARSFYDSSLWESRKLEGDDAVKKLIREGVEYTSAVCVLVGTDTWSRRWVKYEIARSVVDGRGLLAVHLNGLKHHQRGMPDPLGYNPLRLLGIYESSMGNFYLYERRQVRVNYLTNQMEWQWLSYQDYTWPVPLPRYITAPGSGYVMPLSSGAREYDFVAGNGQENIGVWLDIAAQASGL